MMTLTTLFHKSMITSRVNFIKMLLTFNSFTGFFSWNCAHYFFECIKNCSILLVSQFSSVMFSFIISHIVVAQEMQEKSGLCDGVCCGFFEFAQKAQRFHPSPYFLQLVNLSHISNIYDICVFVVTCQLQDFCSSDLLHSLCWSCFSFFQIQKSL